MQKIDMPPQIIRLVLLTAGIVVAYLIASYFLTPPSFGDFGFYRGNALEEAASRSPVYAGKESCQECHAEEVETHAGAEHKTVSCEACHGLAREHVDNPDTVVTKMVQTPCMRCHEANPSRPKWILQIEITDHYAGERCIECHLPHEPNEMPEEEEEQPEEGDENGNPTPEGDEAP